MTHRPWLTDDVVDLDRAVVAEKPLWTALLQIAGRLDPLDWVLVGGQMVALHGYIRGSTPPRTTDDIDLVANLLVRTDSLHDCASAAESINLKPSPSMSGKRLQRFEGGGIRVDLLIPDYLPRHLVPRLRGHRPVSIVGGQRALDRAHGVRVRLGEIQATVVLPDLRGAVVLKARASVAENRDAERHAGDIAFLCSLIDDPRRIARELDVKERGYLRKCRLPRDSRQYPWVVLDPLIRAEASEAWARLTGDQMTRS
jgi:predicted nucleotidyltransferase